MIKKALILAAISLAMMSCSNNKTYFTLNYIGNISGANTITDDDGDVLVFRSNDVVASSSFPKNIGTRVYYFYNQYEQNSDGTYDVEVLSYVTPLTKEVLLSSNEPDTLTRKPILVTSAAYGGGYVNFILAFYTDAAGTQPHYVNLVCDETRSGQDTVFLSFRHNTAVPLLASLDEASESRASQFIASFPVYNLVKEKASPVIKVEFPWYDFQSSEGSAPEVVERSLVLPVDLTKYVQEYAK